MAALLSADVIIDINDVLRLLKAFELDNTVAGCTPTTFVPLPPMVAPAPQRPVTDFATVLRWEEPEEEHHTPQMGDLHLHNDSYLKSGGMYTQRLLARGHAVARYHAERAYPHAMNDPALSNQAPPWPPAPELITNPPNWGVPATVQCAATPPQVADEKSNASSQLSAWQGFSGVQKQSWNTPSTDLHSEDSSQAHMAGQNECATGFFIGRDGTEWPMPPPECMPGNSPRAYEYLDEYSSSSSSSYATADSLSDSDARSSADTDATSSEPRCRIVWSAEAVGDYSDSEDDYRSDSDSPAGQAEYTTPPPLSHSASNSPSTGSVLSQDRTSAPSTPAQELDPPESMAALGLQWYATFGKDLLQGPPAPSPCASTLQPPRLAVFPATAARRFPMLVVDSARARAARRKERNQSDAADEMGRLRREALQRPLPPPPPDLFKPKSEPVRGRVRASKF